MQKVYTENELRSLKHIELVTILEQYAAMYKCELGKLIPVGARKDLMIDTILECQEEKGGAS